MGVEAFCIDVVHLATECVYLVVEGIGIGTAYDAAVLELAFVDFDSCTYKFALLVVADEAAEGPLREHVTYIPATGGAPRISAHISGLFA